jgi:heme-degrading monooxygenase HmoA
MICRIWRGWTTPDNAAAYQSLVLEQVIPGIESRAIKGFEHIDLVRRDLTDEVEFCTLMWFRSLEAIRDFMGEDYTVSHVPDAARKVLSRFDTHAAHYEIVDRRPQG